jgi:polypeptide N-acetylgalactosaminyltransferase
MFSRRVQKQRNLITFLVLMSIILILYLIWIQHKRNSDKIDWNDYNLLVNDRLRNGPGEQGDSLKLTNPDEIKLNKESFDEYGMSVIVSDKISVNRSIPDFRHKDCLNVKYSRLMPKVSIVIIFNNEVLSVFKRTLHSLYNRTPHNLIQEVILVNDNSTYDYLYDPLKNYIETHFPLVKFIFVNMNERIGLMRARVEGAKRATSEFLFITEPHCEMTYNWLPPLIEPLLDNKRVVTVPIIDNIEYHEMKYYENDRGNLGSRGVFDWNLEYQKLKRIPIDDAITINPFQIPVMTGGVFMIRKKYFFEIGPYDEELIIWGAENIEMSLKVNLCGGKLLEVPCSRIGHLFRAFTKSRKHENGTDFVRFNRKRIVEIWFDDYKKYVYNRDEKLRDIEVGDLTKAKKLKDELRCKPFKHFLDVIAPDLIIKYPLETPNFGSGQIQLFNSNLCLQGTYVFGTRLKLVACLAPNFILQNFKLTFNHEIQLATTNLCLDVIQLSLYMCK